VPDQEGLSRIGAVLAQPYHRPDQNKIAEKLLLKPDNILFDRIDDLTEMTCKSPDATQSPPAQ
jgi:hypothetical protein